jgi:glycosyltransferase involved in cell wall biosynthesis
MTAVHPMGPDRPASLASRRWVEHLPSVSLVIPTLNEEANIAHVLRHVPEWVEEVVIVDGRSTDRTIERAREARPDVTVVMERTPGKGAALTAGFRAARGDIIAAIDADGSMDPAELHAYVGQLMAGADLVKGSRFVQGGGTVDMEVHRRLGNLGLLSLVRILFGGRYSDLCYGYFAFWRHALDVLDPDVPGFEIETLINVRALKANLRVAEVPSFEARRLHGVSNLNAVRDGLRILRTILRERRGGRIDLYPRPPRRLSP